MSRFLIADDSDLNRGHLKQIVEGHPGWTVCGEASNGQKAVLLAHQLKPDFVILDLAMPVLDGLHAAAEILKFLPSAPIVIYTLHALPEMEVEAMKFGARALVSKSDGAEVLVKTVERLLSTSVHRVARETVPFEGTSANCKCAPRPASEVPREVE